MGKSVTDWTAAAELFERVDAGSELQFEFRSQAKGTLAGLIAHVAALSPNDRARVVIDAGTAGSFNATDIMAMASAPDFPG
jgi:hypothetical protein